MSNRIIILFSCILLPGIHLFAQQGTKQALNLKYLYQDLRYEQVIQQGQNLLETPQSLSPEPMEMIHQYMAFSFFNLGIQDSARAHFLSLLMLDKDFAVDPVTTSPKVLAFFNALKADYHSMVANETLIRVPHYIFQVDIRPSAAWRSALVPGWGQIYKGQDSRGYLMGGIFFTSLITTVISKIKTTDYRDHYLEATEPDEISELYSKYNNWNKVYTASVYATVSAWILSFADALWSDYPKDNIELVRSEDKTLVRLSFSF